MKYKFIRARRILLAIFMAASSGVARADVNVRLDIGHGYDFYYPSLDLTASNPDPVTYHHVESPNGLIWKNFGTNTDASAFFITNSLDAVLNECNGLWKLYLNKGDGSEQLYHFTVSITDVTTNSLGDVTIIYPAHGSSGVPSQPMFQWTGPTNLAQVYVDAYHSISGNSYSASLPGTATNWMPSGSLTPGNNSVLVDYVSHNFAGLSFTTPTNSTGALSGWTAQGAVFSYLYANFSVASSGGASHSSGHTNLAHYTFDDSTSTFDLGLDSSPHGNDMRT